MRGQSWRQDLDRQATIDEYIKARNSGAEELASRIEFANPDINWESIEEARQAANL